MLWGPLFINIRFDDHFVSHSTEASDVVNGPSFCIVSCFFKTLLSLSLSLARSLVLLMSPRQGYIQNMSLPEGTFPPTQDKPRHVKMKEGKARHKTRQDKTATRQDKTLDGNHKTKQLQDKTTTKGRQGKTSQDKPR
jgi:hypothetical protein